MVFVNNYYHGYDCFFQHFLSCSSSFDYWDPFAKIAVERMTNVDSDCWVSTGDFAIDFCYLAFIPGLHYPIHLHFVETTLPKT